MRVRSDGGAAVLLGVLTAGLVLLVAAVCTVVTAVLLAQRRAAVAADLSALAAAGAVQTGQEPCAAARAVAFRNGARLVVCVVDGEEVLVGASRFVRLPLGLRTPVSAKARAGPVG